VATKLVASRVVLSSLELGSYLVLFGVHYCLCRFVCCVLFEHGVSFCELCLIVISLPPGEPHLQFN
jgi:hypothetical protein